MNVKFRLIRSLTLLFSLIGFAAFGVSVQAAPTMTAKLVDPQVKAAKKSATVEVIVTEVQIIDPATVAEKASAGQGHLHYQVDNGPVIATTANKLSFHGLTPGAHKITVSLAANDHSPLGPQQVLSVIVPAAGPMPAAATPQTPPGSAAGTAPKTTAPAPATPPTPASPPRSGGY